VGTRHSALGKIDEADKYCSNAVNNLKPLVFEPVTTIVLFDIIKSLPNKYTFLSNFKMILQFLTPPHKRYRGLNNKTQRSEVHIPRT